MVDDINYPDKEMLTIGIFFTWDDKFQQLFYEESRFWNNYISFKRYRDGLAWFSNFTVC